MTTEHSSENSQIDGKDTNEIQRAIRERAHDLSNRKPSNFWYSSPRRVAVAAALAITLVGLMAFGADRFLHVFHYIVRLYITQPVTAPRAPAPPSDGEPGVIFVTPDAQPSPNQDGDTERAQP